MCIRHATLADFSILYPLWQTAVWVRPFDEEKQRYATMIALNPDLSFVLQNSEKQIVGSIFGAFDGRSVSIHRLVIAANLQKQGYGKLLIATLEAAAKKKGIKKMVGQVHLSNIKVLGFYKKLGFAEDSVITLTKDI